MRAAAGSFGWLRQAGTLLPRLKEALFRFPSHLREKDFWLIQGAIALVTALHYGTELLFNREPYWTLHHIPVILYIIPIAYASIRYGWEGGLLTSGGIVLLVMPSVLLWHRESLMWLAELARLVIVVSVGVTLASRVEAAGKARRQAEAVSARLALSEARFRSLFEAAGDAILVWDHQGAVVTANEAAARFFGAREPRQLLGKPIGGLVPFWRDHPPVQGQGPDGAGGPTRVTVRRTDGHELLAEAVVTAVPGNSGAEATQAVLRDATAQDTRERGLRSLVHQVTQAQEEERQRIARELHDDTLQALVLLSRELNGLADGACASAPEDVQAHLRQLAGLATGTAEGLRRFSRDLRPAILNDLGLVPAIEWLTGDLRQRTALKVGFQTEGPVRRLTPDLELALFRIGQEALRNVEKHARATQVDIVLSFEPSRVRLTVADNGTGFRASAAPEELVLSDKLGLVGLKERAAREGGTLEVRSAQGEGTEVVAAIPG